MVQRNVAGQKITIMARNSATGAPIVGDAANMTAWGGKDGNVANFQTLATASVTEWATAKVSTGAYLISPSQNETDADELFFFIQSSTANVYAQEAFHTTPQKFSTMLDFIGGVSVSSNNDKTGYSLSSAGITAIWAATMEGAFTAVQYMRGFASMLFGKSSGLETANPSFRDTGDTKNRITGTDDQNGNRSAVTLDLT